MSITRVRSLVVVSVLASLTSAVISAGVVHFLGMSLSGDEMAKWPTENFWYAPTIEQWQTGVSRSAPSYPVPTQGHMFSMGSTIEVVVPPSPVPPPTIEPGPSSFPVVVEPPSGDGNCHDEQDNDEDGLIDMGDDDCSVGIVEFRISTQPPPVILPAPITIGGGDPICSNGEDDDGDYLFDMADPDCDHGDNPSGGGTPGQIVGDPQDFPVHGVAPVDPVNVVTDVGVTIDQAVKTLAEYFGGGMGIPSETPVSFGGEDPPPPPVSDPVIIGVESEAKSNLEKVIKMAPGIIGLFGKVMPIPPAALKIANDLYMDWMNVTASCNGTSEATCSAAIIGTSDAVNEFDGLLEAMFESQPVHIKQWLENETDKL